MSKASILIVEDESIVALDIQNSLANQGYDIAGQTDRGEDAVRKASDLAPDLILMDIGLRGDMDGIEAAIQIRAQFDLPIIFLTAYTTQNVLERAREAEPFGFVVKPFDERELVSNIEMAIYKHGMEKQLRADENKFRGVIENCTDAIVLIDGQGLLVEWNPAAETLTGLRRAEVLGRPQWEIAFQLLPKERRTTAMAEAFEERWKKSVAGRFFEGLEQMLEVEIETVNGERRVIQTNGFVISARQGGLAGAIIRDITDRRAMEEDLRGLLAREQLMGDIIRQASTMIGVFGLDGRRILVNNAAVQQTGYSEAELLSPEQGIDLTPPEWQKQEADKLAELREIRGAVRYQSEIQRKDGSRFPVEVIVHPHLDELDGMDSYFLFANDITERKKAEDERGRLIAGLKEKNEELERFTYTVSHDLRAPLVTILGFLGFLERDIASGRTDRIKKDITQIAEAANKMQGLVVELLELSRVGRIKNPSKLVPFEAIVRDALAMVAGQITLRNVQVEVAPNLPMVYGDAARLTQVLQNLVDNAIKFMGGQPKPRIEIGYREAADEGVVFFVRDNGAGIDPQFHEHIFGLFNRLDPRVEGTGIGLLLVKRIIETHGGRIWVESEGLERGATFCFTLPEGEGRPV